MRVELLDTMGTDMTVVNTARVSFDRHCSDYTLEQNTKLIQYLAKHQHWSPFAHCTMSFRLQAPVFIARQLAKHQVGFSWNEVSRRYVSYAPTTWNPLQFRKASASAKQGSSSEEVDDPMCVRSVYQETMDACLKAYDTLLSKGVCPEQARAVLPQAMNTEWIWTGSLYAWSRMVSLRSSPTSQYESREIANHISHHAQQAFPLSWKALQQKI